MSKAKLSRKIFLLLGMAIIYAVLSSTAGHFQLLNRNNMMIFMLCTCLIVELLLAMWLLKMIVDWNQSWLKQIAHVLSFAVMLTFLVFAFKGIALSISSLADGNTQNIFFINPYSIQNLTIQAGISFGIMLLAWLVFDINARFNKRPYEG